MRKILIVLFLAFFSAGSLAQDEARFIGTWAGTWERGPAHKLIVEKVEGRHAVFLYRGGEKAQSDDTTRARRNKGVIVNGALHGKLSNGAQVTYTMSADGRTLVGHYAREDRTRRGVFERR